MAFIVVIVFFPLIFPLFHVPPQGGFGRSVSTEDSGGWHCVLRRTAKHSVLCASDAADYLDSTAVRQRCCPATLLSAFQSADKDSIETALFTPFYQS